MPSIRVKFLSNQFSRRSFLAGLGAAAALPILAACEPQIVEVERVQIVEKEVPIERVVTQVIREQVERVITVEVEKAIEVERVVTVEVEKAIEVVRKEIVEIEKEVIVEKFVTAMPKADPRGELVATHWWGDTFSNQTNTFGLYEHKHGVTMKDQPAPWGGYLDKLLTQFAGGVAPDVMLVDVYWNGFFFTKELLAPLDDVIKAHNADPEKWTVDPRRENGYKGQIMAISVFFRNPLVININKTLAEEVGMDLPEWGSDLSTSDAKFDTWNWDNLVEFATAGTKRMNDGTVESYGIGTTFNSFYTLTMGRVTDYGGALFDDPWSYEENECTVNSPEVVQAVQDHVDMVLTHKVAPSIEASKAIEGGMYRAGKAASVVAWAGGHNLHSMKFPQGVIHMPWDRKRAVSLGGNHWAANRASKNRDLAEEFVAKSALDTDMMREITFVASVPSYDARFHMDALTYREQGAERERFLEQAEVWASRCQAPGVSHSPQSLENIEVFPDWRGGKAPIKTVEFLNTAVQSVLIGENTVQAAMDDAKKKIDAELKKASS